MAMPVQHSNWTAEMARAIPRDSNRYEVLDGELFVSPAPTFDHQRVVDALHAFLRAYVREHRLGEGFFAPADA